MGFAAGKRFEHMAGNQRNAIAGLNVNRAGVIGAVAGTVQGLRTLICRIQKRVAAAESKPPTRPFIIRFHPCRPVSPKVLEITEAGLGRRDEQDVILFCAQNHPASSPSPFPPPRTPASKVLVTTCLRRRIAGQGIRQLAGLSRIGASQLDRRGRTAALAVAEIQIQGAVGLKVTPAAGLNDRTSWCR